MEDTNDENDASLSNDGTKTALEQLVPLNSSSSDPNLGKTQESEVLPIEDESTRDRALALHVLMNVLECGRLGEYGFSKKVYPDLIQLLDAAKRVFSVQPVMIEIDGPINICGDIHGQYSDLLRIFDKIGFPNLENYLFLGDYVDRGKHGLETVTLLFCYKVLAPETFFLLRGNHECSTINRVYGFYDECMRRSKDMKLWEAFQDCFSQMPLAALIGTRVLCMHGGISNKMTHLNQIREINRPLNVLNHVSVEMDLLWSDPTNETAGTIPNQRGVSIAFGPQMLRSFLKRFDLDMVVRAHQVVQDGYEFFAGRKLVTVFSAPFYCGQFDNAAAVLSFTENMEGHFTQLKPQAKKKLKKLKASSNKTAS